MSEYCLSFHFRADIPSVILYDTSGESDVNINETILRTIEAEGGGIDTPRTVSPSPVTSATATPTRVLSPVPSSVTDNVVESKTNSSGADSRVSSENATQSTDRNTTSINSNSDTAETRAQHMMSQLNIQSVSPDQNRAKQVPGDCNGISTVDQQNNNFTQTNVKQNVSTGTRDNIPPFQIPPVGEYLDVHVNFIYDPSNFVVSIQCMYHLSDCQCTVTYICYIN